MNLKTLRTNKTLRKLATIAENVVLALLLVGCYAILIFFLVLSDVCGWVGRLTFRAVDRRLLKLSQLFFFAAVSYFLLVVLMAWASGAFERAVR